MPKPIQSQTNVHTLWVRSAHSPQNITCIQTYNEPIEFRQLPVPNHFVYISPLMRDCVWIAYNPLRMVGAGAIFFYYNVEGNKS